MSTIDRVQQFRQDLFQGKHDGPFNIFGFIFSSFYLFYVGSPYGFLFFFLPIVLGLLFSLVSPIGFFVAYLISHLIAGFTINSICKKYKEEFIQKFQNVDTYQDVEYFSISIMRLVVMMFLTMGLYSFYWGYKNWKRYQEKTKDDVQPLLAAIFFNLSIFWLFRHMEQTLKLKKSLVVYAILFFLTTNITVILKDYANLNGMEYLLLFIGSFVLTTISLAIPQKEINTFTTTVLKRPLEKKFYLGEIIFAFIGIALYVTSVLGVYSIGIARVTAAQKLYALTETNKYYTNICSQAGYQLTIYPQKYNDYFAQELAVMNDILADAPYAKGELEEGLNSPEYQKRVKDGIIDSLDKFRKFWIVKTVAEARNVAPETVEWQKEWDNYLSLGQTCKIFDENGWEYIKPTVESVMPQFEALRE